MGQFMRQQPMTAGPMGIVLTLTEIDVPASCEGGSAERAIQRISIGIDVQANTAEISAKGGLHVEAHTGLQRLAAALRTLDCLLHSRWSVRFVLRCYSGETLNEAITVGALQGEQRSSQTTSFWKRAGGDRLPLIT
jgi:hypothetical protein